MLLFIQTFCAAVATALFRNVLSSAPDAGTDPYVFSLTQEDTDTLFEYFGTFTRSLLSMSELALANWTPICRFLVEHVHETLMLPILLYRIVVGIAVTAVINAVFIQETLKVATTDDNILLRMKRRAVSLHRAKMTTLFKCLAERNTDGDPNAVNRSEFKEALEDEALKTWLNSMDFDASDTDLLFDLIAEGKESVTVDDVIKGMGKLRGPARSIDMRNLLRIDSRIENR
jgi:hypothetical protein